MTLFRNYLVILVVAFLCSAVPFLHLGMVLGSPAVLLASISITLVFRKELS